MYAYNRRSRWVSRIFSEGPLQIISPHRPPRVLRDGGNRLRSLRANARVTPRKSDIGGKRGTRSVTQNDPQRGQRGEETGTVDRERVLRAIAERESRMARACARRPWVIVIAFKLSLALMANNIRAVSPSLFSFSRESLSLFLFQVCSLPSFCPSLSLLSSSVSSFPQLRRPSASELCDAGLRSGSGTKLVHGRRSRHRRDTSSSATHPALLASSYSPYAYEVVRHESRVFACAGYVRRWRLLSDDAGKKGVIRGLLNALLVRYK